MVPNGREIEHGREAQHGKVARLVTRTKIDPWLALTEAQPGEFPIFVLLPSGVRQ